MAKNKVNFKFKVASPKRISPISKPKASKKFVLLDRGARNKSLGSIKWR